ncbi:MAG TPA: 4a-hydroxytetrahydrobiopterin dehydratase [Thermoleophilaceae bacterium]|jgi:4a-hydroxytetrahydrobiopterin dehydratase
MAVLSDEEIESGLAGLEGDWARKGDAIERQLEAKDFRGSVDLVNRITDVAEEMNHHPDLAISWNKVTLSLSTHSQGGITDSDLELARRIDELA